MIADQKQANYGQVVYPQSERGRWIRLRSSGGMTPGASPSAGAHLRANLAAVARRCGIRPESIPAIVETMESADCPVGAFRRLEGVFAQLKKSDDLLAGRGVGLSAPMARRVVERSCV